MPKYTEDSTIETREDVKAFYDYIVKDRQTLFHPDDDFADIVDYETKKPAFSKEEIDLFNRLNAECFAVAGDDVYDYVLDAGGYKTEEAKEILEEETSLDDKLTAKANDLLKQGIKVVVFSLARPLLGSGDDIMQYTIEFDGGEYKVSGFGLRMIAGDLKNADASVKSESFKTINGVKRYIEQEEHVPFERMAVYANGERLKIKDYYQTETAIEEALEA